MLSFEAPLLRVRKGLAVSFVGPEEGRPATSGKPTASALALALGYRLRRALEEGEVPSQPQLARLLGCTDAWISVLITLTYLAPDIQEAVLGDGVDAYRLSLEELKVLARMSKWSEQRRRWEERRWVSAPGATSAAPVPPEG
jgi:hypothetical protein